jgi:hypothetical protein
MKHLLCVLALLMGAPLAAQSTDTAAAGTSKARPATVQPRIMVIPRIKDGQDLRTVLDDDLVLRIAITKVKEAFDRRGFSTVDFVGRLKAADENIQFTSGSRTDVKEQIIQFSGADIFVEVELNTTVSPQGNSSTVVLSAYEVSTGTSLANKVGSSGRFYGATDDQLIQRAVENSADGLLGTMQEKFTAMLESGRSILVDIGIRSGARTTFEKVPTGKDIPYSELIEQWMSDNAFNNAAHIQGVTGIRMLFDDVRLPLRDPRTGRSYGTNQFGTALASYLRSLGLTVTRDVKGGALILTITAP